MNHTPLSIDLFEDLVCPWCRIGKANLSAALAEWDGPVEVRYHPFMLNPSIPPEGVDFIPYMQTKFGNVTDPFQIFERVSIAGRAAGLEFDWRKVGKYPNTLAGHRLVAGSPEFNQSKLIDDLFEGYFLRGEDIGDSGQLARIASRHGWSEEAALDFLASDRLADETMEAIEGASQSGIGGVPFFIIDQRLALSGAQPPETILAAMNQATKNTQPIP